ncbi:hypothetical protein HMPREF1584_01511 [Gardnerella vaginalis JCP8481A]|nr:hypothetical protein HMPREF1584_01511 [Gardnerella vaginalis JCP8481A]
MRCKVAHSIFWLFNQAAAHLTPNSIPSIPSTTTNSIKTHSR